MNRFFIIICLIFFHQTAIFGQNHFAQNVRGYVIDLDSETPVPGVTVLVSNIEPKIVTVTDESGYFKLKDVPVGRINIQAMLLGYQFYPEAHIWITSKLSTFQKPNFP